MRRLFTITMAAALLVAVVVPSIATARPLRMSEARQIVAKEARKAERELRSEGANRSSVPGCWRNSQYRVSCFFSVKGYDEELDFRWHCMLRMVIRVNQRATTAAKRYRITFGAPQCG